MWHWNFQGSAPVEEAAVSDLMALRGKTAPVPALAAAKKVQQRQWLPAPHFCFLQVMDRGKAPEVTSAASQRGQIAAGA